MPDISSTPIYQRALQAGQAHIFDYWNDLNQNERRALYNQASRIDFDALELAVRNFQAGTTQVDLFDIKPGHAEILSDNDKIQARLLGEQATHNGKVCALVLAGGRGTRLGYSSPKGTFPVGPVSGTSLFAWFAEKLHFLHDYYQVPIRWLVMTSPATDEDTRAYFRKCNYFGLGEENIYFFPQGTLPMIDTQGKILMDATWRFCESPDGHGGVISALEKHGLLEEMDRLGVDHLFIHNVDNCMVKLLDPEFVGYHIQTGADLSLKCLARSSPIETLGTLVTTSNGPRIIEYSDTPPEIATLSDSNGQLVYRAGSINTYLARLDFFTQLSRDRRSLPCHFSRARVTALDRTGNLSRPEQPNAIKLETKLFDALTFTKNAGLFMANRAEEFSPLKRMQGEESSESVSSDLRSLFISWLEAAGISLFPNQVEAIEISPRFAVDRETFLQKVASTGVDVLRVEVIRQAAETGRVRLGPAGDQERRQAR